MEYSIVRSDRKTVSLCVRGGKVLVRAPLRLSEEKIAEFVHKHERWIARRIAIQTRPLPDFSDGTSIELNGIKRRIKTGKTLLTESILYLPAEGRETVLKALMKKLTLERMAALTREIASIYKFRYEKIVITSAHTRWGSCNTKGTIAYTFRSAFLPDSLAVYLAVHELCHTRHMNHGKAFWALVQKILPDYKERRKALKEYSWAMKCL